MEILNSVVIPCKNGEKTIAKTLESLTRQQFPGDFEVILVNDGSNDRTLEIVESFRSKIPNLKIISESFGGVSKARNAGLNAASGKFLAFLDADDHYRDNFMIEVGKTIKSLQNDPHFHGVFTPVYYVDENFKLLDLRSKGKHKLFNNRMYFGDTFACPFLTSAAVFRRSSIAAVDGFDPHLDLCEDHKCFQNILKNDEYGYFFQNTNTAINYMLRSSSASNTKYERHYFSYKNVLREIFFTPSHSQNGLSGGDYFFRQQLNERILHSSTYALVKGDIETAKKICEDLYLSHLTIDFYELLLRAYGGNLIRAGKANQLNQYLMLLQNIGPYKELAAHIDQNHPNGIGEAALEKLITLHIPKNVLVARTKDFIKNRPA